MIRSFTTQIQQGVVPVGTKFNFTNPRGEILKLVVLAGMPGCGRTVLLKELAYHSRPRYLEDKQIIDLSNDGEPTVLYYNEEGRLDGYTGFGYISNKDLQDRINRWSEGLGFDLNVGGSSAVRLRRLAGSLPSQNFTGTIMIDTPEGSLHPNLANKFLKLLRYEWPKGQLIVASNVQYIWAATSSYARWFFAPYNDPRSSF